LEHWEDLDQRRRELQEEQESLQGAIEELDTDIRILTARNQVPSRTVM
jgi:prefoldin subunit 5